MGCIWQVMALKFLVFCERELKFNAKNSDFMCISLSLSLGASENGGWPCRPIKSSCFVNGRGVAVGTWWEQGQDCCSSSPSVYSLTWMNLQLQAGPDCWCSAGRASWNWLRSLPKRYELSRAVGHVHTPCLVC